MKYMIYYIGLCLILPLLLLLFYLEKRARRIIISMICGVLAGPLSYIVNNALINATNMNTNNYTFLLAPFVEEIAKFIFIFTFSMIVKKGKRGSAANAFAVGLGFGVAENFYYLVNSLDTVGVAWIILRSIGTCLMHCMSSTIIGSGVYYAREKKKHGVLFVVLTLLIAILFHGIYNYFVLHRILKVIAILLPIILFIIFFFALKQKSINNFFWDKEKEHTIENIDTNNKEENQ